MVGMELLFAVFVMIVAGGAECFHQQRIRRVARLAFGPSGKATAIGRIAPFIRVAAMGILSWGLVALLTEKPKVHRAKLEKIPAEKAQHLVLVLDVSPSMRIEDSGDSGKKMRLKRASEVVMSLFARLNQDYLKLSVIATYNGAIPVVKDTRDLELVQRMLDGLPMHFAFEKGKTKLFDGIQQAADLAADWQHGSTTLLLISDGETVPSTGMPQLPPSVADVVVVGVGDPVNGTFSNGQQSRQNVSELQQIANRLGGTYHDGNVKHVSTDTLRRLNSLSMERPKEPLGKREYALIAIASSSFLLAVLPLILYYLGSPWRPAKINYSLAS